MQPHILSILFPELTEHAKDNRMGKANNKFRFKVNYLFYGLELAISETRTKWTLNSLQIYYKPLLVDSMRVFVLKPQAIGISKPFHSNWTIQLSPTHDAQANPPSQCCISISIQCRSLFVGYVANERRNEACVWVWVCVEEKNNYEEIMNCIFIRYLKFASQMDWPQISTVNWYLLKHIFFSLKITLLVIIV